MWMGGGCLLAMVARGRVGGSLWGHCEKARAALGGEAEACSASWELQVRRKKNGGHMANFWTSALGA